MCRIWLVALLLLPMISGIAEAAENPEQKSKQSKHARATIVALEQMGINDQEIVEFATYVNQKVDGSYVRIAEEHTMGGKFSLSYKFSNHDHSPLDTHGPVIQFTPDNSHWQYTAGTQGAIVSYQLHF